MTNLVLYWLLFGVPVLGIMFVASLFVAMVLGAHLYHAGGQGKSPTITLPRFSVSRAQRNGGPVRDENDRLPAV